MLTDFIVQFGRERTFANTCAIRFGDTQNIVNAVSANTGTRANRTGHRVGTRHIRIGTVVNVKHGALSAFKEEGLPFVHQFVDGVGNIGEHRLNTGSISQRFIDNLINVERFGTEQLR